MTEITRLNYQQLIPEIKNKIKDATFICFDAEFSGLGQPDGAENTSLFDTGAERYEKMRRSVLHNTCPQVGFCIFHKDKDESSSTYNVDGYQAYITEPAFAEFNMESKVLSLEYKCSKFLRKCNFSFNDFLDNSIPCLNQERAKELKSYLQEHPDFMQLKNRYFDKVYFPELKANINEEEQKTLIKNLRGFSEIADVITEYKIPFVGHNMALDVLYYLQLFCAELPENYEQFKQMASHFLPPIYDTKFMTISCKKMLNHPVFKANIDDMKRLGSSSLYVVYQNTSLINDRFAPCIELKETCSRFKDSLKLGMENNLEQDKDVLVHSPAFDACITGQVFLNIAHISARIDQDFEKRKTPPSETELFANVNAWKDQIFLGRATIICMCLKGNDPQPSRPHWIEVQSTRKIDVSTLQNELSDLFGPVDAEQANEKSVKFAAAGGKSGKQMKQFLKDKGYFVKSLDIPWDKQRYKGLGKVQFDRFYDKSKMLGKR